MKISVAQKHKMMIIEITSIYRVLASQLYSTPINPVLGLGLIQSLPQYLYGDSGVPYSVRPNTILSQGKGSQPLTIIDYNDPAYAYLQLD